jgi:hypothetical protein
MTKTHEESAGISIAVIAILAALAMLGVVAITLVTIPLQLQQAEAAPGGVPGQPPGRGCEFTPGGNASKTRCVH